jgi:hypothetical protein
MQTPAYSQGPWRVAPETAHPWVVEAQVVNAPPEITAIIARFDYRPNAFLAAAAPELLEALVELESRGLLQALIDMDEATDDDDGEEPIARPSVERARAAIVKALQLPA